MALAEIVIRSAADLPGASCATCGQPVASGEGIAAVFRGRTLRFRCPGCLTRFAMDPDHYLEEGPAGCCDGDAAHEEAPASAAAEAPSSEWVL
jgi:hypothetical protein